MPPGGLANVGSTCYINTCIQCLGFCSKFRDFVLSKNYKINKNNLMNELEDIYVSIWINKNSLIPRKFIKSLKDNITSLEINEQNDIGEFMIIYLDKLNESICDKLMSPVALFGNIHYNLRDNYENQQKKMDEAWYKLVAREYSSLIPLMYGQSIMQIICGHCGKIHHNYEMFSILTLPLTSKSNTMHDCIKNFFKEEELNTTQTNQWTCDKCNKNVTSLKTHLIWRSPEILMLSLKRFTDDLKKNNKNIEVPLELNFAKYTLDKNESRYKLCSVSNHIGSYFGGHYFSICNEGENEWVIADDLEVKKVQTPSLGEGYIYFYQRI